MNGVEDAFLEHDPMGIEHGHRWLLCANTRTGSKEFLCVNLAECEQAIEDLERICRDEARLTDADCRGIVEKSLDLSG